jgi:hypothetical protein
MRLESGPARTDRNWWLLRTVVCLGIATWFAYDGARGYYDKNRAAAELKLSAPQPFGGKIKFDDLTEKPTKRDFERVLQAKPASSEQLYEQLGRPVLVSGTDQYFMSRYGYAKVTVNRDGRATLSPSDWVTWAKTKEEIDHQFYWAAIWAVPGLYFLYRLIKAATLRAVIDDEGMTYGGKRIVFADLVSLRDYSPKGWIDLYYQSGARQKKLRLDNEKILLFDDIVAAICQVKGFRNEVKEYAEQKARQQAAEEAAAQAEASVPDDEGQKNQP